MGPPLQARADGKYRLHFSGNRRQALRLFSLTELFGLAVVRWDFKSGLSVQLVCKFYQLRVGETLRP